MESAVFTRDLKSEWGSGSMRRSGAAPGVRCGLRGRSDQGNSVNCVDPSVKSEERNERGTCDKFSGDRPWRTSTVSHRRATNVFQQKSDFKKYCSLRN